ncbi:MAG: linear amide C-N hydrolase [Pseudomonadota bacterium]
MIEFLDGEITVFDAPLGVMTNAPTYDWHLTNLRNYVNLSPVAVAPVELSAEDLKPLGVGSGMIGLPGDFTPPSRFVRAIAFTQTARETADGKDTAMELFRILDNFNLPLPVLGPDEAGDLTGMVSATQWTTALDVTNRQFHFHSAQNRRIQHIDLTTLDFAGLEGIAYLPLNSADGQDMMTLTLP